MKALATAHEPEPASAPSYRPGSRSDFDRLYRDSYGRLVATLTAVLGNRAAAEDCVQEAFVKAYSAWPRWKPDAPAEGWLHRIALNVAISYRRRERLREVGEVIRRLGRPDVGPDPSAAGDRSDLMNAIAELPPKQAAAIVFRYHHGYTNREIAAALGIPERTVASRLAAARDRLRVALGPAWNPDEPEMGTPEPVGVS